MPNVTLIDNYDSFTWNLVHCLGSLGATVAVRRNDQIVVADVVGERPDAIAEEAMRFATQAKRGQ
jgi:anthranilate synthase component 2